MMESKNEPGASALLRVLTLDGGGAKGFYTLGVLKEIEAMVGCPLHQKFDLVFGTSTGAIIASLIALGHSVDSILELYRKHVPTVMSRKTAPAKSRALKKLASEVCGVATFSDVKTGIGIVTAMWLIERLTILGQRRTAAWLSRYERPGLWHEHRRRCPGIVLGLPVLRASDRQDLPSAIRLTTGSV